MSIREFVTVTMISAVGFALINTGYRLFGWGAIWLGVAVLSALPVWLYFHVKRLHR